MRLYEMHQESDFDALFQRATLIEQLEEELNQQQKQNGRRGSLPDNKNNGNNEANVDNTHHRRVKSCKVTSNRKKHRTPKISYDDDNTMLNTDESSSLLSPTIDRGCTNLLTPGYLFPKSPKSYSAPHSRSSSWKKSRRPSKRRSREDCNANERHQDEDDPLVTLETLKILQKHDLCPVRTFSISAKGIKNRGDSFKRKSASSLVSEEPDTDLPEITSGSIPLDDPLPVSPRDRSVSLNSNNSTLESSSSPAATSFCDVTITGSQGVGKTALMQQFMTSEFMGASETSFDDEKQRTVSVVLEGEETTMNVTEQNVHEFMTHSAEQQCYVIIYAATERATFERAEELLQMLRQKDAEGRSACILVANKVDVERSRQVSTSEGKDTARRYDVKFIEVSAVLNHKIDDLLVGIVKQIRLSAKRHEKRLKNTAEKGHVTLKNSPKRGFFSRLFRRGKKTETLAPCDNLLVD